MLDSGIVTIVSDRQQKKRKKQKKKKKKGRGEKGEREKEEREKKEERRKNKRLPPVTRFFVHVFSLLADRHIPPFLSSRMADSLFSHIWSPGQCVPH